MLRLAAILFVVTGCLTGEPGDHDVESGDDQHDSQDDNAAEATVFVFAHGFASTADNAFDIEILEAIAADGHSVTRSSVPSVEGLAVRGPAFAAEVDRALAEFGASRAHIIAHSMGGLDARYAISQLGYGDRIASLTTMSTPHRGSPIADYSLGLIGSEDDAQRAFDAIIAFAGDVDPDALRRNLVDLSVAEADQFNANNPDDPRVLYQSFSGLSSVNGIIYGDEGDACTSPRNLTLPNPMATSSALVIAAPFVGDGPADGVVPVSSARWGTFRGCLAVDHTTETGTVQIGTSPLDMLEFYRGVAEELSR